MREILDEKNLFLLKIISYDFFMKKKSIFILCCMLINLLLWGCSSSPTSDDGETKKLSSGQKPTWIQNTDEVCPESQFLCAVGDGDDLWSAELAARKSLASFFETRIKSEQTQSKFLKQRGTEDSGLSGEMLEEVQEHVTEIVDQVLTGVEVGKRFQDAGGQNYILVRLNKRKSLGQLQKEMAELDEQMSGIFQENTRSRYRRLKKLYFLRKELGKKYELISGGRYPEKFSFQKIHNIRLKNLASKRTVYISVQSDFKAKYLQGLIKKLFLDFDYTVVPNKKQAAYRVNGSITEKKEFLKVAGFEKYSFVLHVVSKDSNNQEIGGLHFQTSKTGRDKNQAKESAIQEMKKYIIDHIDELNLH